MGNHRKVIFVDDEEELLLSLIKALRTAGLVAEQFGATTAAEGLKLVDAEHPQVVVCDLTIDPHEGPEGGFALIKEVLRRSPSTRCIVLTGHGSTEFGVRALEAGAANFLQKPPDIGHLRALIEDGFSQSELRRERDQLRQRQLGSSTLIGASAVMQKLREQVSFAAGSMQPVLLQGETGTGKGLCAVAIHRQSARASKNFVRYQPAFGAHDLIQSDLFGHEKGAFTGALTERRGLIREAERGTLFLDEIDALPCETQILLLGALQDKKIRRVGADREVEVDFRLISATNVPLRSKISDGQFRLDLYHRIAHLVIDLPPLRERTEDIPDLVQNIIERLVAEERIGYVEFEREVLHHLQGYHWPGNVRELEAVVERAATQAQFLNRSVVSLRELVLPGDVAVETTQTFSEKIEEFKRQLVQEALTKCAGNQSRAAELLKIDRTSLRRILGRSQATL